MSGVVNDIEALAEFRSHLMRFNHDLMMRSGERGLRAYLRRGARSGA